MIGVLPVARIISIIAVCYAVLISASAALIWRYMGVEGDAWTILSWSLSGATALQIILLIVIHWAWRFVWQIIPKLNDWVFPDLNGKWDIEIEWHGPFGAGSGTLTGDAIVRQSLLKISMDVTTKGSVSHTLTVSPKMDMESNRPRLIYVFRINPRGVPGPNGIPYRGAAVLDHFSEDGGEVLHGKYWTERGSVGDYSLTRV